MKTTAMILVLILALTGCAALSKQERAQYAEWTASGELVVEKKPGMALYLGFLPGGGSFYVGKPARGILDLLLWYPSIFWDGPISRAEAFRRNYEATEAAIEGGMTDGIEQ